MHFETLQMISLNGEHAKPNDDRCGCTSNLAWVVDGATNMGPAGLLGAQGGAAWLASTTNSLFAASRKRDLKSACETVFDQIEMCFEAERTRDPIADWEMPKAAFSAVQLSDDKVSIAWAADCPALLARKDGSVQWCTGEPDTSGEAADALALGAGVGAQPLTGAALDERRAHRGRSDHFALGVRASAAKAVTRYAGLSVSDGDEVILMSDGFASLITDYDVYSAEGFAQAIRAKGLAELASEIRAIEQEDAACMRYPRFKVSDDATALWLKVVG